MSLPTLKSWWSSVQYLLRYLVLYVDFCRPVPKGTETPCEIFGVSGQIFTKIAPNVAKIVPYITSEAELRYLNPLRMSACWIKVILHILPKIGCHSNVPKVIKKRSGSRKFKQIPFIWWKDRENRSSRAWDSVALLKVKKKKLTQAKYIAQSAT